MTKPQAFDSWSAAHTFSPSIRSHAPFHLPLSLGVVGRIRFPPLGYMHPTILNGSYDYCAGDRYDNLNVRGG